MSQIDYTAYLVDCLKNRGYEVPFKYVRYVWGYLFRNTKYIETEDIKMIKSSYGKKIGFDFLSRIAYYLVRLKIQLNK